jgi:YjbE family integral membrane protein
VEFLTQQLFQGPFWIAALQIIGVNIILSGDNAVVIALACRMLPPRERFWGMILGAGVAVLLRVLFTLVVAEAMQYPWLKLIGGILLLWIAVKLLVPEEEGEDKIAAADNLWRAVRIVAIADIVMSLDNVIAIAASAETAAARLDPAHADIIKTTLIVFGLATSVPMIVAGSALLMALLDRFPILVWGGAGLLGWVAGEIMIKDPAAARWLGEGLVHTLHLYAAAAGALFVLLTGWVLRRIEHKESLIIDPPGPETFPHKVETHPKDRA